MPATWYRLGGRHGRPNTRPGGTRRLGESGPGDSSAGEVAPILFVLFDWYPRPPETIVKCLHDLYGLPVVGANVRDL